jgi:hypothetical protein
VHSHLPYGPTRKPVGNQSRITYMSLLDISWSKKRGKRTAIITSSIRSYEHNTVWRGQQDFLFSQLEVTNTTRSDEDSRISSFLSRWRNNISLLRIKQRALRTFEKSHGRVKSVQPIKSSLKKLWRRHQLKRLVWLRLDKAMWKSCLYFCSFLWKELLISLTFRWKPIAYEDGDDARHCEV